MKNKLRFIMVMLSAFMIVSLIPHSALAEDCTSEIIFKDNEIEYNPGDQSFMVHNNITPGDVYNDALKVTNNSTQKYDLYLQLSVPEQTEEALKLLDMIKMDIKQDGGIIYSGTVTGEELFNDKSLKERYLLGIFDPNTECNVEVKLTVSGEMDNDSLNITATTDWKLIAVAYEDKVESEDTDNNGTENKETEIKPGTNPKTGDNSNHWWYIIALAISASIIGVVAKPTKVKKP